MTKEVVEPVNSTELVVGRVGQATVEACLTAPRIWT